MEDELEVGSELLCDLSNGAMSNDLEWPLPGFQGLEILNFK